MFWVGSGWVGLAVVMGNGQPSWFVYQRRVDIELAIKRDCLDCWKFGPQGGCNGRITSAQSFLGPQVSALTVPPACCVLRRAEEALRGSIRAFLLRFQDW
jgi:hypothetical protein